MNIENKTVLITGGAGGIGKALAEKFAANNCRVIICGRNREALEQTAAQFPNVISVVCDLRRDDAIRSLTTVIEREHQSLSMVVNNAAVQFNYDFNTADAAKMSADIEDEIAVNFTAVVKLTARLLPILRRNAPGAIVNIGSGLALAPKKSAPVYCATKAALHSFSRSLRYQMDDAARESGKTVRVYEALLPLVETQMTAGRGTNKIQPAQAAAEIVRGIERDKAEIRVGKTKTFALIHRFLPEIAEKILRNS